MIKNNKTNAHFSSNGKTLIFYDGDYETVDIISSYFTEDARVQGVFTKDGNNLSLIDAWKTKADEIAKYAIEYANEHGRLSLKAIREGIYKSRIPECTTFKISQAIAIYDRYLYDKNERTVKTIFDPFAGWGDRAIGALMSTLKNYINYYGTDPNTLLKHGYNEIMRISKDISQKRNIKLFNDPAEDFDFNRYFKQNISEDLGDVGETIENVPDLIFSSPPYFDLEIYSDESSQSIKKHSNYEDWKNWFFDVTRLAFSYLKVNGYLIYYLGRCGEHNIPGDLINFMKTVKNAKYEGQIETHEENKPNRKLYFYVWKKTHHLKFPIPNKGESEKSGSENQNLKGNGGNLFIF